MADKKQTKKKQAVSPINGQPLPRGKPFTSETAREAARKSNEKQAAQRSITAAFKARMLHVFTDPKTGQQRTGAEIIADSIIKGAANGNAKMVEIALDIMGETPTKKYEVQDGRLADLIEGLKENNDIYTETETVNEIVAAEQAETN